MAEIDARAKVASAGPAGAKPPPDPARARASIVKLSKTSASAGVSIVIHAEPGVGKTSLVKTLPIRDDKGKAQTLFVNIEGGDDVLAEVASDLDTFTLRQDAGNLEDLVALCGVLTSEDYRFVVFDSVTNLEKRLLDKYKGDRGKEFADLDVYGDLGEKVSEYLRRFTDLRWRGVNCVVFAHTTKAMRGMEKVACPLLQPKTCMHLLGLVSAVGFMSADHEGKRTIRWGKDDVTQAKSRYDCLQIVEEVPKDHRTYLGDVFRRIFHERKDKIGRGQDPEAVVPPAAKPVQPAQSPTQGQTVTPAAQAPATKPVPKGKTEAKPPAAPKADVAAPTATKPTPADRIANLTGPVNPVNPITNPADPQGATPAPAPDGKTAAAPAAGK